MYGAGTTEFGVKPDVSRHLFGADLTMGAFDGAGGCCTSG